MSETYATEYTCANSYMEYNVLCMPAHLNYNNVKKMKRLNCGWKQCDLSYD